MSGQESKNILQRIDSEAMSREEIEEALNDVSKDDFLDQEMKRLGFWDPSSMNETDKAIADLEEKCDVLRARLVELQSDQSLKDNAQKRLAIEQKKRKALVLQKREERKKAKEAARKAKIANWEKLKNDDIIYLGKGVSSLLNANQKSEAKLRRYNVPIISNIRELATLLEMDIPRLRRLAYHRKVSRFSQYLRFNIPKKQEASVQSQLHTLLSSEHKILY